MIEQSRLRFVLMKSTVSQRGVVFLRNQDISVEQQKILGQKLGELTGKPETSKVLFIFGAPWLFLISSSFIDTLWPIAREELLWMKTASWTTKSPWSRPRSATRPQGTRGLDSQVLAKPQTLQGSIRLQQ